MTNPFPRPPRADGPDIIVEENPGLFTLITLAFKQGKQLIKDELALLKMKASAAAKRLGVGALFVAAAVVLCFYLLFWLLRSVELAFALLVPDWAASLITVGVILVLLIVLALIGVSFLRRGSRNVSDMTESIKEDLS